MLQSGVQQAGYIGAWVVPDMESTPDIRTDIGASANRGRNQIRLSPYRRRFRVVLSSTIVSLAVLGAGAAWLGTRAAIIQTELTAASGLIAPLKHHVANDNADEASATVKEFRSRTSAAKEAANDPVWTLASGLPSLGANFSAVAEIARSADDVASLGLQPLVNVYSSLDWETLIPSRSGTDLTKLEAASPSVSSAARAVRLSADRLNQIDTASLLPQVGEPLARAREQLNDVTGTLNVAADAAGVAPSMLGSKSPRTYLLMIQNNAETRATGGIPGALAVLTLDRGKLELGSQNSASALGPMVPLVDIEPEQRQIYTSRVGKFMQDVNLTPDFPTTATTARAMWEQKTGQGVDGVISIDPVVLGYILDATGPVDASTEGLRDLAGAGLPTELTGSNVVPTLLSDVYARIAQPKLQDAYFAEVAQEVFTALSGGKGSQKGILEGLSRGVSEGRVLVWSGLSAEQSVIGNYALGGSISGRNVAPGQFGAYFNDGTGAKMDFYVRRTVQLVKECPKDGYEQTTVRITSTNTAPEDAASSLPPYVTGDGHFGVPAGSVQTNLVAYGPVQAQVETAKLDGNRTEFASYLHSNRPVGVYAIRLAPGETKTVEFRFGKIVQHAEPNLVVTPTVHPVSEVILPTEYATCD